MASKDQNKSQKSNSSTAAGQGKQSTPLPQKNKPSEHRISIQEYSPEVAAASSSTATSGSKVQKKKKEVVTDAPKESKPSSSSDSLTLPTSSAIQQQGTSDSSGNAAKHNTNMDDTVAVDVDYNEDEDEADDDEGPFGRKAFSELAFDRMRDQVGVHRSVM